MALSNDMNYLVIKEHKVVMPYHEFKKIFFSMYFLTTISLSKMYPNI